MKQGSVTTIVVPVVAALVALSIALGAQAKTTADGVFTEAQARRGRETYVKNCSSCHLENLRGEGFAAALTGDTFMARWDSSTVGELFMIIQATMPADNPKSLTPDEYADIVAYLLKTNGYPAGPNDLSTDSIVLKHIPFKKSTGTASFKATASPPTIDS
jgi:S-disulfanyl-L-cysteine oxidoreductase SoxD